MSFIWWPLNLGQQPVESLTGWIDVAGWHLAGAAQSDSFLAGGEKTDCHLAGGDIAESYVAGGDRHEEYVAGADQGGVG